MQDTIKLTEWFDKYQASKSEEWYGGFHGIISDADLAIKVIDDFKSAVGETPVVIYGAGMVGVNLLNVFNQLNINVICFIDRDAENIQEVKGYPVYTLDGFLKSKFVVDPYFLFVATGRMNYREITEMLDPPHYTLTG